MTTRINRKTAGFYSSVIISQEVGTAYPNYQASQKFCEVVDYVYYPSNPLYICGLWHAWNFSDLGSLRPLSHRPTSTGVLCRAPLPSWTRSCPCWALFFFRDRALNRLWAKRRDLLSPRPSWCRFQSPTCMSSTTVQMSASPSTSCMVEPTLKDLASWGGRNGIHLYLPNEVLKRSGQKIHYRA